MTLTIQQLTALQILDSRGNPTLEVEVVLSDGTASRASVPSGASTGSHEAVELRDGSGGGYAGRSVTHAAANVEGEIAAALTGFPAEPQAELDRRMIALDGAPGKQRLGANAILGVSLAVARAVARSRGVPLWKSLCQNRQALLPVPMINILSGGLHAGRQIEFQDFLVVPHGFETLSRALEAAVDVHRAMTTILIEDGHVLTGVADEGGLGPQLASNEAALEYMIRAIEAAGYAPGRQISLAIDSAASHFFHNGTYQLHSERRSLQPAELIGLYQRWLERYPIVSIEDGLAEDDWEGWRSMTQKLGRKCRLIGDDFLVTNPARLERAISMGAANAVLVKMNQIGTLTETFQVIDRAAGSGFTAVISARSGETEDSFLADLAVASGAGQIKIGSITRSERLAKYNRLLRIEDQTRRTGSGPAPFAAARQKLLGSGAPRSDARKTGGPPPAAGRQTGSPR
jgi:enolase